jgi:hypothetical protein
MTSDTLLNQRRSSILSFVQVQRKKILQHLTGNKREAHMFEDRLPFIAAIVSNLIVVGISYFYFEDYFYLTLLVLIISVFLTAKLFNPWALMASALIALSAGAIEKNDTASFNLIVGIFLLGTILQLATAMTSKGPSASRTGSTLSINTLSALLGVGFCYALLYWVYQNYFGGSLADEGETLFGFFLNSSELTQANSGNNLSLLGLGPISIGWLTIMATFALFSLEPLLIHMQSDPSLQAGWLAYANAMAYSFARMFLLGPLVWAALFASITEVRFHILQIGELLNRFFAGIFSLNRVGCLVWVVLGGLFFGVVALSQVWVQNPKVLDYFFLAAIGTIIVSLSLGTAYSVTRYK